MSIESIQEWTAAGGKVEGNIVRGVKILGLESLNGRRYRPEAARKAIGLYEGSKVNVNHPKGNASGPRDYQDRFGAFHNVGYREGQGLFGDFHFNPKHAVAEQFKWDVEHAPNSAGFSHNVDAQTSREAGKVVVESIVRVRSVDLVADPATTGGIFEAQGSADEPLLEIRTAKEFADYIRYGRKTATSESIKEFVDRFRHR